MFLFFFPRAIFIIVKAFVYLASPGSGAIAMTFVSDFYPDNKKAYIIRYSLAVALSFVYIDISVCKPTTTKGQQNNDKKQTNTKKR